MLVAAYRPKPHQGNLSQAGLDCLRQLGCHGLCAIGSVGVDGDSRPGWVAAVAGGLLLDGAGYQITFVASAALLVIAAMLAFLTTRAQA